MRISELFDELDERELNELLDLPAPEAPAVSARDIRRRVNQTLDADPAERRVHMKQAYKKGICAALVATCLLTGAFAAAAKLNLLRDWLDEDSIGELVVNTDRQSIETDDLRLTLEESLSDETTTYIAYSVTALSDEGIALLNSEDTASSDEFREPLVEIHADGSTRVTNRGNHTSGHMTTEVLTNRTDQKLYSCYVYGKGSVYLTLQGTEEHLAVPQTPNAQSVDIVFDLFNNVPLPNGTTGTFYSLRLTSLGFAWDARAWDADERVQSFDLRYMFAFLMEDGSIRTMGQLMSHSTPSRDGWAEVLDLRTVKAVILNDTAYFLDGSDPRPCPLPDELGVIRLEPSPIFTLPTEDGGTAVLPGYPARALLEPFGGTVEYDATTKTAVLTHGDYTCTVTVGSPVVQYGDGQSLTSPVPTIAEIVDGTLYLFPFGFDRTLGIYDCGVDYKYEGALMDPLGIEAVYYTV